MSEWKEVKLGDVINLKRGYDLPNSKRTIGKYPIISSSGITDYHNEYMKEPPGVVTGRYGTIGKVFYTEQPYWPLNTTLYVTDFYGNDSKFIYYFLQSFDFEKFSDKSTVPGINRNHLHTEIVNLPSLPEQTAIASVLSSLDDKIDLLHRQNATLEKMAETLFRQWFVEEAKEEWEEVPLSDFFDFLEGPGIRNWQYTESGTPFMNIRLIENGEINVSKANFVSDEEANGKYKHFLLREDDMVVSTSGTLGKTAIVRAYHLPLMLNTSIIRFRPKDDKSYSFVYQYLQSSKFQEHLDATASGSVQANFGPTHLKQMKFSMPPKDILTEYLIKADPIYKKIKSNYHQIRTLTALRDNLLPKLMNGEVKVI